MIPHNCMECEHSHITILNNYCRCKITGDCYSPIIMADKISENCPLRNGGKREMKLINKSRGTGKTTQLIYASAITGFRIITSTRNSAKYIEGMAKTMGLKIPEPMSDVEYRNRRLDGDHTPILIDDVDNKILNEALELYFNAPVVAATMTVPIDDDCVPPMPKAMAEVQEDGSIKIRPIKIKTNREVFNETFDNILTIKVDRYISHLEDSLTIETKDGKNLKLKDWLDQPYTYKEESDE